jgi:acetyl-CoA carboxylase biotin carboxyl carrier protein
VDLSPDDVRDVLRVLDSSGLDELHVELDNLTLTVRREGASGWTAEQQVLRRPVVEGGAEPAGVGGDVTEQLPGAETGRAAVRRRR